MSDSPARTFSADFKRFFVRGLVVLLPTILTLWIVVYAYQFVDNTIAEPINRGIRLGMYELAPYWEPLRDWFDPSEEEIVAAMATAGAKPPLRDAVFLQLRDANIQQWWADRWYMDLIGLVVAIVAVYVAGRLLGGYIGRRVYRRLERLLARLPIFKQVYPSVKQVVDFLFAEGRARKFSRVVLCEYPRKGVWVMGFQTGPAFKRVEDMVGESVTVFIPSTPGTVTGYTAVLPRSDVVELPITVDEAIRFAVSGGVLVPDRQTPARLREREDAMLEELAAAAIKSPLPRDTASGDESRGTPLESGSSSRSGPTD
jgi:uncharacterized membrane protein